LIKEEDGKFVVYSEEGKRLSRPFASKREADKRLGQIEYFKQQDGCEWNWFEDDSLHLTDADGYEDAEYEGRKVSLNSPFRTPKESKKFAVYVKNSKGNVVKVRFGDPDMDIRRDDPEAKKSFRARHNCSKKSDKTTPGYWSCRMWAGTPVSKMADKAFKHRVFLDMSAKRIRSVRDGVQEYYGVELGMEPHNRVFTVYRSPETIAGIADELGGIPITNDHVDVNDVSEVQSKDIIGSVKGSEIVEFNDGDYDSTLYLENPIVIDDRGLALKSSGKKEFSLGYNGRLKPHDVYDFEQINIVPTHLGLVDSARGGSVLTFVDKKEVNMGDKTLSKVFLDAEGNPNLQQIVEIAQELPEALKKIPVDKIQEAMPVLQEIVAMGGVSADMGSVMDEGDKETMVDMETEYEDMEGEDKEKFEDSKLFKSIIKSKGQSFSDSKQFKDAVKDAVSAHAVAIQKARDFVSEDYVFADKSTVQIMKDALAAEHGEIEFADSELSTAFKMLKKSGSSLEKFADGHGKSALESRIEQQLEAK